MAGVPHDAAASGAERELRHTRLGSFALPSGAPTFSVLIVPCASDPPTCSLVSMAAAIVEKGVAKEVWLLPYGTDYKSDFGATPIARAMLLHMAVEFELSAAMHAVRVAPPSICRQSTRSAFVALCEHINVFAELAVLDSWHKDVATAAHAEAVAASASVGGVAVIGAKHLVDAGVHFVSVRAEVQERLMTRGPMAVVGLLPLAVSRAAARYHIYRHRPQLCEPRSLGFIDMRADDWAPSVRTSSAGGAADAAAGGAAGGAGAGASVGTSTSSSPAKSDGSRPLRRIGVLGGSFNPITDAHLHVASEVLASQMVDEVWVVPCGPRPDKPSVRTSAMQRLTMTVLSLEARMPADVPIMVCAVESFEPVALASYTLLKRLHVDYPGCAFSLVVGTDLIPTLPKWKHAEQLWREVSFLVYQRPGYDMPDALPTHARVVSHPDGHPTVAIKMSSTRVRRLLEEGRCIDGLVPAPLANYIRRYNMSAL